jgi:LytS/YehU family sensor histidine kinase
MRFETDFSYQLIVDENIDLDLVKIPSMLVQPYVENAIKHGLLHKEGNKTLNVNFAINENILEIKIDDNGVGRKYAQAVSSHNYMNHQSFATEANQKRLAILNKYNDKKVAVSVKDKTDHEERPTGTLVTLSIPIN